MARIQDAVDLCDKRHKPQFIGFLDEKEQLYTEKITSQMGFKNYMFWGGHTSSERVVFGAFPDYIEPSDNLFPIQTITVTFRTCDQLSHRDFLGALLSLGIERETLGDFLIEDGRCVFFVREEISQFILMQVKKIGRVGVTLKEGAEFPLPMGRVAPIVQEGVTNAEAYINPVPSGLVLTGIVVSVSVSAFSLALVQRLYKKYKTIYLDEILVLAKKEEE